MLEKTVPKRRNSIRGSFAAMSFLENSTQTVEIINMETKGINGRIASINGRIFPVRSL